MANLGGFKKNFPFFVFYIQKMHTIQNMIYLNENPVYIPKINPVDGDSLKLVNQVTKSESVHELTLANNFYTMDSCTNLNGQYDYFVYDSRAPQQILQSGIASNLGERSASSYTTNINIQAYNG